MSDLKVGDTIRVTRDYWTAFLNEDLLIPAGTVGVVYCFPESEDVMITVTSGLKLPSWIEEWVTGSGYPAMTITLCDYKREDNRGNYEVLTEGATT